MKLLSFFEQFTNACDFMGVNEGLAVRLVSFFLEEDAYRFYTTQTSSATRPDSPGGLSWPVLVHQFLKRYCTEDVLTKAYDSVTRARQRETETEAAFADRIQDAALECGNVFDERTLVNHYVSGLLPTVRYAIAEAVLQMKDDIDMSVARRMAIAAGETHRARTSSSKSPRSRVTSRTMVVEPVQDTEARTTSIGENRTPLMILPASGYTVEHSDTTSVTTNEEEVQGTGTQTILVHQQQPHVGSTETKEPPQLSE